MGDWRGGETELSALLCRLLTSRTNLFTDVNIVCSQNKVISSHRSDSHHRLPSVQCPSLQTGSLRDLPVLPRHSLPTQRWERFSPDCPDSEDDGCGSLYNDDLYFLRLLWTSGNATNSRYMATFEVLDICLHTTTNQPIHQPPCFVSSSLNGYK